MQMYMHGALFHLFPFFFFLKMPRRSNADMQRNISSKSQKEPGRGFPPRIDPTLLSPFFSSSTPLGSCFGLFASFSAEIDFGIYP